MNHLFSPLGECWGEDRRKTDSSEISSEIWIDSRQSPNEQVKLSQFASVFECRADINISLTQELQSRRKILVRPFLQKVSSRAQGFEQDKELVTLIDDRNFVEGRPHERIMAQA